MPIKENVLIRAGECAVTILPQFGGKIASIRIKGRELLQTALAPLAERTRDMAFAEGDAGGWDECLPTVAPCTVETPGGVVNVPDHGDVWRVAWEPVDGNGSQATLRAKCFSLPLELERSLKLSESGDNWRLQLNYILTNRGRMAVQWSWSAHPLFAVDTGDTIQLPGSIKTLTVEGSAGERLGSAGASVDWPVAKLAGGGSVDLRVAGQAASGIGDKLFTRLLKPQENWCVVQRPKAGLRMRMSFDTAATPYLGLWLCYGGWPEGPGAKQMCVAPEPCTAPADSLAKTGPWTRVLAPGESNRWSVCVDFEVIQGETHA
ncbi:MAG TPA: hypothetical protein VFI20_09915 [Terracidiphilus sp.]|nr:hypothetical protein [Terracidiphilus sp.]